MDRKNYRKTVQRGISTEDSGSGMAVRNSLVLVFGEQDRRGVLLFALVVLLLIMTCRTEGEIEENAFVQYMEWWIIQTKSSQCCSEFVRDGVLMVRWTALMSNIQVQDPVLGSR